MRNALRATVGKRCISVANSNAPRLVTAYWPLSSCLTIRSVSRKWSIARRLAGTGVSVCLKYRSQSNNAKTSSSRSHCNAIWSSNDSDLVISHNRCSRWEFLATGCVEVPDRMYSMPSSDTGYPAAGQMRSTTIGLFRNVVRMNRNSAFLESFSRSHNSSS